MVTIEPDLHIQSSSQSRPYPSNRVREHRNAPELRHEPSCVNNHSSFTIFFSQTMDHTETGSVENKPRPGGPSKWRAKRMILRSETNKLMTSAQNISNVLLCHHVTFQCLLRQSEMYCTALVRKPELPERNLTLVKVGAKLHFRYLGCSGGRSTGPKKELFGQQTLQIMHSKFLKFVEVKSPHVGVMWKFEGELSAQVSSSSLNRGSKLRSRSSVATVLT
ncbi:hypothetical protein TNCV_451621 [Trichonephila clavipes]|nr:hypothetical protein TNCV_451621 [Trichonephila clavipes]